MSKSYVTMETAICPICGKDSETGAILIDTRMRDRFEMRTPTHWDLCPEHKKLHQDGFIALVEVKNTVMTRNLKPDEAVRTGLMCHVKREVFLQLFGAGAPADIPMVFVEPGLIQGINERVNDEMARQENQKIIDSWKSVS